MLLFCPSWDIEICPTAHTNHIILNKEEKDNIDLYDNASFCEEFFNRERFIKEKQHTEIIEN